MRLPVEPPRGHTVTDRHGQQWLRMRDGWVAYPQCDRLTDWPALNHTVGPLMLAAGTTWVDPASRGMVLVPEPTAGARSPRR